MPEIIYFQSRKKSEESLKMGVNLGYTLANTKIFFMEKIACLLYYVIAK